MKKDRAMTFGPQNDSEKETFAIEGFRVEVQYAIQKIMKTNGVSRTELARRMGLSKTEVSSFFLADSDLTVRTVAKIFFALGHRIAITSTGQLALKVTAKQITPS